MAAMTMKLFTAPGTRAQIIEFAARELGVALTLVPAGDRGSPAYRAVHPFGKLPAAQAADGTPIFESGAILLYLADASGAAPTASARANIAKWVLWSNASFWPEVEKSRRAPPAMLAGLESALAAAPFLLGDRFTVADVAVGSYLHYAAVFFGERFSASPAVLRYLAALRARPAFRETIGAE
jgi:glutathione S-transferase